MIMCKNEGPQACLNWFIPEPVGPIKSTLLFSNSTLSSLSLASDTPDSAPDLIISCKSSAHKKSTTRSIIHIYLRKNLRINNCNYKEHSNTDLNSNS